MTDAYTDSFIESAQARNNVFHDLDDTKQWLKALQEKPGYKVEQIPLEALEHWYSEPDTGNLKHASGKFFSIMGLDCKPAYDAAPWQQPIINQPEVGILGILSKQFDGIRYFLMQAKMEPGNVNKVQISPTLQATYSNYTQTHKGRKPPYLDYFLDPNAKVIRSQLQSETGSRFFRKFNRNVLLDVTAEVDVLPGFRWLTLHELQALMALDNAINMDSRSVLSNISYSGSSAPNAGASAFFRSINCTPGMAYKTPQELRDWLAAMRRKFVIDTAQMPLRAVTDWVRDASGIHHAFKNYFTIAGVRVEAAEREVSSWSQPLLKHEGLGLAGFLCADIGGVLHFLVQAKSEPGIVGSVELGPTVPIFDYRARADLVGTVPFLEYFLEPPRDVRILHSSIQSEEGGRFWNLCNQFVVLELPDHRALERPERYEWMTLEQLQRFSQGESLVNSEARTLLSCLQYFN